MDSVLRRLEAGSSGVEGEEAVGEAAALCMNFIVRSLEDIAFGAGVVAPDMMERRSRLVIGITFVKETSEVLVV